jgi:hypothetical protein
VTWGQISHRYVSHQKAIKAFCRLTFIDRGLTNSDELCVIYHSGGIPQVQRAARDCGQRFAMGVRG